MHMSKTGHVTVNHKTCKLNLIKRQPNQKPIWLISHTCIEDLVNISLNTNIAIAFENFEFVIFYKEFMSPIFG